ncbi:MAG: branched-chain amino acid ABC transporter substrate-binding protein [Anaerolineae bacterium]|jgi:branched-chain amino acid transport system substrate-binding protein
MPYHIFKGVILCLLVLVGCTLPGGTQPLVKIGLAAPFEGLDRPLGYEALQGVKLALAERNAAGGVGGYKVELVALNDFDEPDEAQLQAREFAADPAVVGVVMGWTGTTTRASLPVYRQVDLAVVVPWSVPPELADREAGLVLVAADTRRVARVLADALAATRHPRRIAVVGDEASAAPYLEALDALQLPAQVIPPPGVSDDEISAKSSPGEEGAARFTPDGEQPDAVVLATDGALAGETLLALRALDWSGITFGGADAGSVHLVNVAGDVADGVTFASPAPAGRDVGQITEGDIAPEVHELGPRAVLAYDATHVLLDAIELAIRQDGYPTRRGVVAALPEVQRQGLTGNITFDVAGRRVDAPVWLYNIAHKDYPGQMLLTPWAASSR